jgi:hypothetical protein
VNVVQEEVSQEPVAQLKLDKSEIFFLNSFVVSINFCPDSIVLSVCSIF